MEKLQKCEKEANDLDHTLESSMKKGNIQDDELSCERKSS